MKQQDVPQDAAILEHWREISYAVDEDGRYVLTPSAGWDVANLANLQAWQISGQGFEGQGFPAENLLQGIDAVPIFRNASTAIGGVD